MHPNQAYRQPGDTANLGFAATRGFGILAIDGPLLAHVPFVVDPKGKFAELHLVRSNPIALKITGATPAKIAVSGPDGYVSPDWYGIDDQVPTWNYVAVHLSGTLEPLEDAALPGILGRLSAQFEARLAPKPEWTAAKMDPDALARMIRMIRPFKLNIEAVDGTWKLNQNKPDAVRISAAENMNAFGIGQETPGLAALMRDPDKETE